MNDDSRGQHKDGDCDTAPAARRSLWPWFVTGDIVVFVAMAFAIRIYSMLPSGRGIVALPLWRYYMIEARRALGSPRALGPASVGSTAAISILFQHIFCSAIGGAAMFAIGWVVRQILARRHKPS